MTKNVNLIQSIQRAINILNCFDKQNTELGLNEISKMTDLNVNTTRGIVNTLLANSLLSHNKINNVYSLGYFFMSKYNLLVNKIIEEAIKISNDTMYKISDKMNVTTMLQVIDYDNIYTVNTANPKNSHYILTSTHSYNFPLHATSSGKILLAYKNHLLDQIDFSVFTENTITDISTLKKELENILLNGYSTEIDEIGFGISSIAVPILDNNGALFGTLSVTALTPIILKIRNEVIEMLKEQSKFISTKIF